MNSDFNTVGSAEENPPSKQAKSFFQSAWIKPCCLALLFIALVILGYSTIFRAAWDIRERTDFTVYRAAGQAVVDGTNIYAAHNARGWNYVYPPPFAIAAVPFAYLSVPWGVFIWYLASLIVVAASIYMSASLASNLYPVAGNNLPRLIIPAVVISPFLISGLMRCQASAFMYAFILAAFFFCWRGRPVIGGLSLAAATLVKAFPIALLAYFVWGRRWRLLAGFLMGMVIGGVILPAAVFGCGQTLDYWSQWSDLVAKPALAADDARQDNPLYDQLLDAKKPRNQSMQSLLLSLNVKPAWAQPASGVIALVMLGLMLLAFRERRNTLLVGSAFLVWLVLIPPISESHYFGVLLLPLAVLVAIWQNDPRSTPRRLSAAVLWFFVGVALLIVPRDTSQFFKELQLLRPLCWSSLSLWCVLMVFAFRLSSDSWIQFQRNQ